VIGVAVALVLAAAVPVALVIRNRQATDRLRAAVRGFAAAWQSGSLGTVAYHHAGGTEVATQSAAVTAGLTDAANEHPAAVVVLGVDGPDGSTGTGRLRVRWDLGQGRSWEYPTAVPLTEVSGAWQVDWTPSVVHPKLTAGQVLTGTRTPAGRGRILGARQEVLAGERTVVTVGIQPGRTSDKAGTAAAVAALVGVDAADLTKRVLAAAPTAFVEAITLRQDAYLPLRDRLQPIPGAVFRTSTRSLSVTPGFARALLGTVGPATKEIVDASQGRVRADDVTGLSGLQRRYDAHLAGTPGLTVRAVPAGASSGASSSASPSASPAATSGPPAASTVLFSAPPVDGATLVLSLDATVQKAAESVLDAAAKPAALVAIRPSTGEVLAVANGPAAAAGYNRALIGRYPPGSTFKVATGYALLQAGVGPSTPVDCPAKINVGGRQFTNAENEVLGPVPFHTDFAQSCNTAFIGASRKLTARQLADAASALGYGRPNQLGVDAFTGSVPADADTVEHAADAIGQGTVLASPLTVASVSASVAAGRYLPPKLVLRTTPAAGANGPSPSGAASTDPTGSATDQPTDQATDQAATDQPTDQASSGSPLAAAAIGNLRTLMAEVVTSGTGTALRGVPGGPVHGKTGTAEFGTADPPQTHAWFTGYQGDLAFAVVVEGGGFGGKVAAPLAASFLARLH
jgi:cell division protein FtsI/penicillin-binding protein 2